jgi:hypothetical protein
MRQLAKQAKKELLVSNQAYGGIIDLVLHHELCPGVRFSFGPIHSFGCSCRS